MFKTLDTLLRGLAGREDRVAELQAVLTACHALGPDNGGQGEMEKVRCITNWLKACGVTALSRVDAPDPRVTDGQRPNLVARIPGKSSRTLWLFGHTDVVPPGDLAAWTSNPWQVRRDGDFLYGRGVEDNQQAIVTAMLAAEALIRNRRVPDLSLGLLFVADEETGMSLGLPHVLDSAPELFGPDDLFLVPDMGDSDGGMVEVAEKSSLWLRLTAIGKQCHASTTDEGVNSLVAASACVIELERLYRVFRNKNPMFSPSWSTFVPSKKEANVENINTLPGKDVFFIDCLVIPEYPLADVVKECRRIADAV